MNFRKIYNECNQLSENMEIPPYFEKVYFECNVKPLFEQVLREAENYNDFWEPINISEFTLSQYEMERIFEQTLKEMGRASPNYFATLIKNAFVEKWQVPINEQFARQLAKEVINEVTKDGTLVLLKNWAQSYKIKTKTANERCNALQSIKKFVDITLKICEKNAINSNTQNFEGYFKDKKRITQIYTALSIEIAKWFKIPITDEYWKMAGFTPLNP